MKLPFRLLTLLCILTIHANAQLSWEKYSGSLPLSVVIGGKENGRNLAVCRAIYNNAFHAGKVVGTNCNIGWGGSEMVISEFEVLVKKGDVRTAWVNVVNGVIPTLAVEAGTEDGRKNWVGQATRDDGSVHPGKVIGGGNETMCNYGWGGAEIVEKGRFRILVTLPSLSWVAYDGSIPGNAVVGGQENGNSLYVCRASYEGAMHAGKVIGTNCNIGWGGREIEASSFEVLVNGGVPVAWVPFTGQMPKGAVKAGDENGKPMYVGQGTHTDGTVHAGKIIGQPGEYIFNYGYGGEELTLKSNFKILVQRTR